jgi:23S rRNA (cytosine1962-C5)-methyltransferase
LAELVLKPGRERSVLHRHPWIFSGAVLTIRGSVQLGETVSVLSSRGEFLAKAAYNPNSKIIARIWTWEQAEDVTPDFLYKFLERSINNRGDLFPDMERNSALRLVHGESDGLPGLIVDRYADVLVVQILAAGAEYWRETLLDQLEKLTGISQIYERSDVDVRRLEGLPEKTGFARGSDSTERILITENGLHFSVNIRTGHKTGFYLDQRKNRRRVRDLTNGKDILDCFCYTGGFSINASAGGARSVMAVDSSAEALNEASENYSLNKQSSTENISWLEGDVFKVLRELRDRNASFDMVILDPPKFAPTASQVESAARGYKDINLLGFKLLRQGGLLVTFSCSGGVSEDLFQKIVAGAALDAGVHAQILERLCQSPDHPVALNFPEGAYLKGLVIKVA